MKTNRINLLGRLTGLSLAVLFSLAVSTAVSAVDAPTGKGGATLLKKAPPTVTPAASHSMSCAQCKDEFSTRRDLASRGATKPSVLVARHLCPGCETKVSVTGHGKAKQDVVAHSCTLGTAQASNCCGLN